MTVKIVGMEMPKSCVDCSLAYWDSAYMTQRCPLLDRVTNFVGHYIEERSDLCPLQEVKE